METYEVKNLILIDADPLYINKDQEMFIDEEFNDNYIIPNATLEELNQDKEFPSNNESSGDNEDKENVDVEEKQSSDGLDEEDKEVIIADSSSSTDSDDKGKNPNYKLNINNNNNNTQENRLLQSDFYYRKFIYRR